MGFTLAVCPVSLAIGTRLSARLLSRPLSFSAPNAGLDCAVAKTISKER